MLRISLQRFAQFATGRIRRGGHDRQRFAIAETISSNSNDTPDLWLLDQVKGSMTSTPAGSKCRLLCVAKL
jgi:hypothetical protein